MRLIEHIRHLRRDESGASIVELAIVVPLFLLLTFGFIDFARLGFTYVMTGKAMDRAVRMAVVLSPPCPNVPTINGRGGANNDEYRFGTSCNTVSNLCAAPGTISCAMDADHSTSNSIWSSIQPLMPVNASPANVVLSYEFTPEMGFLGGPYTPIVTARIDNLTFEFITPLGALAGLAGASDTGTLGSDFAFPSMSASLPAEALSDGETL